WRIEALQAYPQSIVTIYDRYGRQALQTPGPLLQWNGRLKGIPLSAGVYYYVIDLKAGEHHLIQGSVTLLR
ncbi:MAG TPA: gliding motility-associated C-terminal domain-containing protein, partial [Phnomibacter sp.]|nr:gliding motility-associated C-terminal domain-containing protein [Phnomibacter sp.]